MKNRSKEKIITTKAVIKYLRKEDFKIFIELLNVKVFALLILIAIALAIVSYICDNSDYTWVSNFLISASTGVITGLVLYVLTNIRNISEYNIDKDFVILSNLDKKVNDIYEKISYISYYFYYSASVASRKKFDWHNQANELYNELCLFAKECENISYKIFKYIFEKNNYNLNDIKEDISNINPDEVTNKETFIIFSDNIKKKYEILFNEIDTAYKKCNRKIIMLHKQPI